MMICQKAIYLFFPACRLATTGTVERIATPPQQEILQEYQTTQRP